MVYGFKDCYYELVNQAFQKAGIKTYDYTLGNEDLPAYRADKTKIYQVKSGAKENNCSKKMKRICKSALVNFVLEQVRKKRNGERLDKVIFCIDKEENPNPLTSLDLANKENKAITLSEARRALKLCQDPNIDPEIQEVAREIFAFVKVRVKTSEKKIRAEN